VGRQVGSSPFAIACELTGVPCAAILTRGPTGWQVVEACGLGRTEAARLQTALADDTTAAAVDRAVAAGKPRLAPATLKLTSSRTRLIPLQGGRAACCLLGLRPGRLRPGSEQVLVALAHQAAGDDGLGTDLSRSARAGLPGDLDGVLERFARSAACDAADLAIRWGDRFRIAAVRGQPEERVGEEIPLAASALDARLVTTRRAVRWHSSAGLEPCPWPRSSGVKDWLAVPLVLGERVIGRVGLASRHENHFDRQITAMAEELAGELAPVVEGALLFQEATRRLARLAVVQEIAPLDATVGDSGRTIVRVLSILQRTFNTAWVSYLMQDRARQECRLLAGPDSRVGVVTPDGAGLMQWWEEWTRTLGGPSGWSMRSSRGWLHPEAASSLVLAVRFAGTVQGFFVLETPRAGAFSEDDERLMGIIGGQVGLSLENARLFEEMGVAVEQLTAIRETALDLASQVDHPEVLENLVERVQALLHVRAVELGLVDPQAGEVRILVSRNPWRDFTGTGIPLGSGLEGGTAVSGQPVVGEAASWWRSRGEPRSIPGIAACIPLHWGSDVIGVISVLDDDAERRFSAEDMRLLELLAPQAAITLRTARLVQDLRQQMAERKQTEAQLIQSAKLAAVGQMAAGIAHEINNPLTTVAGFAELWLQEIAEDEPIRAELEMVGKEARRARQVVLRLLDFARQRPPARERVDLNEVVREGIDLVRHLLALHGVELTESYAEDLPWIEIDKSGVKQVVLNLAHNALQAMPQGGRLTLQTRRARRDGRAGVSVALKDNGPGIAPEHLARIFEPFFTTKPQGEGTGLGLAVSYGIIADHGGTITVESVPPHGALFVVWLPMETEGQL
jgi:signal transduction histidine kinase